MTQIHTSELPQLHELLRGKGHQLKYLSLDCFDTILWRNVALPTDVFYRLQHMPCAGSLGLTAALRIRTESDARTMRMVDRGSSEVTLEDIYRTAYPDIDAPTLEQLAREELECEQEACFGYPPVLDLIRHAHQSGLKIIIVSDTYLTAPQLRELLAHNLPADVMACFSDLFVSSEFGVGKSGGLFARVLGRIGCRPEQVLHLGDNPVADYQAPLEAGINAFHFLHYGQDVRQLLQMNSNATAILNPEARSSRAMPAPFHPVLAGRALDESAPETILGYCAAGPLLYAFAEMIRNHALSAVPDKPAKYLFLMRDGYLPQLAFNAIAGDCAGRSHAVEVSRFVSYACSFRSLDDIDRYLARMSSDKLEPMARQLLLTDNFSRRIIAEAGQSARPFEAFCKLVRRPGVVKQIQSASAAYRQRFYRYLERTIDLQRGDRLVLVDLGYSGTAQTCLQPILEEDWDAGVEGLYLLLSSTPRWEQSRAGLIDPALAGDSAVSSIVPYVAALEMICTNDAGSVVDYTDTGEPVRKEPDISAEQHRRVRDIQARCLEFVSDAQQFLARTGEIFRFEDLRLAALGALGRMTFFPSLQEVQCMQGFYLDINLNTDLTVSLFDTEHAAQGLRKMGLFHALNEQRMNIPTELRYHSLESALSLLVQHRYQQNYSFDDFSLKRETLPVMLARGAESSVTEAMAYPAHDGYYSLIIPVGQFSYDVGVQFGVQYEWLQLGSISVLSVEDLFARKDFNSSRHDSELDLSGQLQFDQIEPHGDGLLHCCNRNAFVYIPMPRGQAPSANMLCLVNYRPIVAQQSAA